MLAECVFVLESFYEHPGETISIQLVESPLVTTYGPYHRQRAVRGRPDCSCSFVWATADLSCRWGGWLHNFRNLYADSAGAENAILNISGGAGSPPAMTLTGSGQ